MAWGAVESSTTETLFAARYTNGTWTAPERVLSDSAWASNSLDMWIDAQQVPHLSAETYTSGSFSEGSLYWAALGPDGWDTTYVSGGPTRKLNATSDSSSRVFLLVTDLTGMHVRNQQQR